MLVKLGKGANLVHGADYSVAFAGVDDVVDRAADVTQVDCRGGVLGAAPVPLPAQVLDQLLLLEDLQHRLRVIAEDVNVGIGNRQLVRRALDMADGDVRVIGVDDGVFRILVKEIVRVAHEVLINGRVVGDQEDQGFLRAATCASGLLPRAGDGAGVADHEAGVEAADINAEFERVGAGDAEDIAFGKTPLDLAALLGEIAAAIGLDFVHEARGKLAKVVARPTRDQFGSEARADEGDGLDVLAHEAAHEVNGLAEGALAFSA